MMKCPNCGEENPDEMKFCGNCGTKLPEKKNFCPNCNKEWPLTMKFCGECGFKFGSDGAANKSGSNNGLSMGDKNVIAGDVMGKKDETNISGNATIIKNEDESKKTAKCHVCGSIVLRIEGYDCPVCGQFTCKNCYVPEAAMCKTCRNSSGTQKEDVYKQAVKRVLEDGKIDMQERVELKSLQQQLGLTDTRILELENLVKSEMNLKNTTQIGTFDKINFEKAKAELYDNLNFNEALNVLEPLHTKYPNSEVILADYLFALSNINPQKAKDFIKTIQADVLCLYLTQIDFAVKEKNYSQMEEYIVTAEKLWPDSILLKCRKAEFNLVLALNTEDESYLNIAGEIMNSCSAPKTKLERTWLLKVKREIAEFCKKDLSEITEEYCTKQNVYKGFFIIRDEKLNKMSLNELLDLEIKTHYSEIQYKIGTTYMYSHGDYQNAFKYFEKAARQGNRSAQIKLGDIFYDGINTTKDYEKALYWYTKKNPDEPEIQLRLANCYFEGNGVSQDYSKAFEWYKKAAEKGIGEAQSKLGEMYYNGIGTTVNLQLSKEWYDKALSSGEQVQEKVSVITKEANLETLQKSAENGDVDSLLKLAEMYYQGNEVNLDYKKALDFYTKAAKQGNATAQNILGNMYYHGEGVTADNNLAFEWYKKAAEQGFGEAQQKLGEMYETGCGVEQDLAQSTYWYNKASSYGYSVQNKLQELQQKTYVMDLEKAASQGDSMAMLKLGQMYYEGKDVTADYGLAFEWYKKAAEQGIADAQFQLGRMFDYGEGVIANSIRAFDWYKKAAEQDIGEAQCKLGELYENGRGVEQDLAQAIHWYSKALSNEENSHITIPTKLFIQCPNCDENNTYGSIWCKSCGTRLDNASEVKIQQNINNKPSNDKINELQNKIYIKNLEKTASQGDSKAQFELGEMYYQGNRVIKSYNKAQYYCKMAAEQGNANAQFQLGKMYYNGQGVGFDYKQAFEWFSKAAANNNAHAQFWLGHLYSEGEGVDKNLHKAKFWYKKAAANGLARAKKKLEKL